MAITYRMLPLTEWDKLEPLYHKLFPDRPFFNSDLASVAVAEEDGQILGFWVFQLCAHAEPVGIDPDWGQNVNLFALRDTILGAYSHCPGMEYYINTPDPRLGQILEDAGYTPVGVTFSGVVP